MSKSNSVRQKIKVEENVAANSLRTLIYSIAMSIEDKVVLEDMINKLSQEADTMLDIINDIDRHHQRQLLVGYKKLLQSTLEAVNRRLKDACRKVMRLCDTTFISNIGSVCSPYMKNLSRKYST